MAILKDCTLIPAYRRIALRRYSRLRATRSRWQQCATILRRPRHHMNGTRTMPPSFGPWHRRSACPRVTLPLSLMSRELRQAKSEECHCPCHNPLTLALHPVPCCETCPLCGRRIVCTTLPQHLERCRKQQ